MNIKKAFSACGFFFLIVLFLSRSIWGTSCRISVIGVSFGSYNVMSSGNLASRGSVTYTCTSVTGPVTIYINRSITSGSFSPREMKGSQSPTPGLLNYNLYLDAAGTKIWGDGTSGTLFYGPTIPPGGSPVTVSIYGIIPSGQNVLSGSYFDTDVVQINF